MYLQAIFKEHTLLLAIFVSYLPCTQWEDAPSNFAMVVTNVTPQGDRRKAVAYRTLRELCPARIGLALDMKELGEHLIEVSIAEVDDTTGELGKSPVPPGIFQASLQTRTKHLLLGHAHVQAMGVSACVECFSSSQMRSLRFLR
jgi:hypothetical protein